MDLVNSIRKEYGLDIVVDDAEASSAIQHLTHNLEHACRSLGEELYSKSTHFVLELVQNADDNKYADGVTPTLSLLLDPDKLTVWCNEVGFNAQNVRAICSIGKSTKTGNSGYIGEKGIGFKSVFTVADVVRIWSREYAFMFDKRERLGVMAPIWIGHTLNAAGWTIFSLDLSAQTNRKELVSRLEDIQPSLLLFLRKLHRIKITTAGKIIKIEKTIVNDITRLRFEHAGQVPLISDYILFEHTVTALPQEEKRKGVAHSQIVLAFPVTESGEPVEQDQDVHAFLPLRSHGFRFVIQGDFLTSSNREDILADRPWNRVIRDHIPAAVVQSISKLRARPALAYTWMRYLRIGAPDGFFASVHSQLLSTLQQSHILLSSEGASCKPANILILPVLFKDDKDGKPLVPSRFLGLKSYIASGYDTIRDAAILAELGVKEMSASDFLCGLSGMQRDGLLSTQDDAWWENVCRVLQQLIRDGQREKVRALRLAPLANGTWTSPGEGELFFDSPLEDIPQDIDVKLVKRMDPGTAHYRLLEDLGVKEASYTKVAEKIIVRHWKSQAQSLSPLPLVSHARFLFRHRSELRCFTLGRFWVVTTAKRIARTEEVYLDHPSHASLPLRTCLRGTSARFLHADYDVLPWTNDDEELVAWQDWLHDKLGVHIAPRVLESGLSPEVREFVLAANTSDLLSFLRKYSKEVLEKMKASKAGLQQLRELQVTPVGGGRRALHTTYLKRGALAQLDNLPFLPVDDPEDSVWDFLSECGVSLQVDGELYLKVLILLSEKPLTAFTMDDTFDKVKTFYKQLEARFNIESLAESVRQAFKEKNLIYVPAAAGLGACGAWKSLTSNAIVWEGPPSMRSRFALKDAYPDLGAFFCDQLKLPPCPGDILLQELQAVHKAKASALNSEAQVHVHQILCDLDVALRTSAKDWARASPPAWTKTLAELAFIPTEMPSGAVVLKSLHDGVFLPDLNGDLAHHFRGRVPLVSIPPGESGGTLLSLHRIFACKWLAGVKQLESSVMRRIGGVGTDQRLLNVPLSKRYGERMLYLRRYAQTILDPDEAADVFAFLQQLQNLHVYTVQSDQITHVYELGEVKITEMHTVGIETTDNSCNVFLGGACSEEEQDMLVSRELARLCPAIRPADIITVLTQPIRSLNALYPPNGPEDSAEFASFQIYEEPDSSGSSTPTAERENVPKCSAHKRTEPRQPSPPPQSPLLPPPPPLLPPVKPIQNESPCAAHGEGRSRAVQERTLDSALQDERSTRPPSNHAERTAGRKARIPTGSSAQTRIVCPEDPLHALSTPSIESPSRKPKSVTVISVPVSAPPTGSEGLETGEGRLGNKPQILGTTSASVRNPEVVSARHATLVQVSPSNASVPSPRAPRMLSTAGGPLAPAAPPTSTARKSTTTAPQPPIFHPAPTNPTPTPTAFTMLLAPPTSSRLSQSLPNVSGPVVASPCSSPSPMSRVSSAARQHTTLNSKSRPPKTAVPGPPSPKPPPLRLETSLYPAPASPDPATVSSCSPSVSPVPPLQPPSQPAVCSSRPSASSVSAPVSSGTTSRISEAPPLSSSSHPAASRPQSIFMQSTASTSMRVSATPALPVTPARPPSSRSSASTPPFPASASRVNPSLLVVSSPSRPAGAAKQHVLGEELPAAASTRVPSKVCTEEQEAIGILGEVRAFQYLSHYLPGFTHSNWTSTLRTHMDFPPFTDVSVADFAFRDLHGILTAILFGPAQASTWRGKWPMYFLEVKATSATHSEPFHMSSTQLSTAFKMRMLGNDPPQNVYVLVRVSSVRSNPDFQMFPDPWRLLCEGRLRHTSDAELAIT